MLGLGDMDLMVSEALQKAEAGGHVTDLPPVFEGNGHILAPKRR